jgi:DNA repair protein RecN (Recombination protein N)
MLIELRVRDYAVIDDLSLELQAGLNVLSGETGAGKSLIVGALSLLVGERASSHAVRKGSDKALVEAVFDVSDRPGVGRYLSELGFSAEDDLLLLRREVAAEGRNRAWINGSPATASAVGEVGTRLLDIHGQHEHQSLLHASSQRHILDVFAGAAELASRVGSAFSEWREREAELAEKEARIQELEARADFLRFQLSEIQDASLREGEEEALEEEARRLGHAEELAMGTQGLHDRLYGGEDSLSDQAAALKGLLEQLARLDPSLTEQLSTLEEAYHLLAETGRQLSDYASDLEFDPGRLEEIGVRQDLIFRLKRKYGPTVADVEDTGSRVASELSELDGAAFDLKGLNAEVARLRHAFEGQVQTLSKHRKKAAGRLEKAVAAVLPELGLEGGTFQVRLSPLPEPGPTGGEGVAFLVSLNPGFDPGPLARIASGGELSRVMLALKSILAGVDQIPSLIFDEIDAGIGGEVALKVADRLRGVAKHHQVFVITHLPQLASRADHQFLVEKADEGGMASTRIRELTGEERILEVARMLGGDPHSSTSRQHARELLGEASDSG